MNRAVVLAVGCAALLTGLYSPPVWWAYVLCGIGGGLIGWALDGVTRR